MAWRNRESALRELLEPEQQARIGECAQKLRAVLAEYGDEGDLALTLVFIESTLEG